MKKRICAFVLIMMMLLSISATAAYDPPDSPDASYYISSYSASVANGGNGKIKVTFNITGTGIMTSIGASAISIYKSNGTYVTTIYYFSSGRSGMMGSNKMYHSDTESIYVGAGSYYAVVTFYAGNSSGSDSKTAQTSVKTVTNP